MKAAGLMDIEPFIASNRIVPSTARCPSAYSWSCSTASSCIRDLDGRPSTRAHSKAGLGACFPRSCPGTSLRAFLLLPSSSRLAASTVTSSSLHPSSVFTRSSSALVAFAPLSVKTSLGGFDLFGM